MRKHLKSPYAVARVRLKERERLTAQDLEQLLSVDSYRGALRILQEKGYSEADGTDSGCVLVGAEESLWTFFEETADSVMLTLLRLPIDYYNLKAAVKAAFAGIPTGALLLDYGSVSPEQVEAAVQHHDTSRLPPDLARAAEAVLSLLRRTQDGQLCDFFLDRAKLRSMKQTAADAEEPFCRTYAAQTADLANLRTALRGARVGKNADFIDASIYPGGTLDTGALSLAAENGVDSVCAFTAHTPYRDGVTVIQQSPASFEIWCSDWMMQQMERTRYDCFSDAPVLAYAYAKQTELQTVQMILSAKQNHLHDRRIQERVKRCYGADCSNW